MLLQKHHLKHTHKYQASHPNRVFPGGHFAFCMIIKKGGATTCPKGLIRNVKVHPGSSDPPSEWSTWEEYLQSKPGEFTPNQIVAEMAQNQLKINRAVATILEMFNWYSTSKLVAVVGLNVNWEQTTQVKDGDEHCWTSLITFALTLNNSSKFSAVTFR